MKGTRMTLTQDRSDDQIEAERQRLLEMVLALKALQDLGGRASEDEINARKKENAERLDRLLEKATDAEKSHIMDRFNLEIVPYLIIIAMAGIRATLEPLTQKRPH